MGVMGQLQKAGLAGIEPAACRLGGDCSILLSYSPNRLLIVTPRGQTRLDCPSRRSLKEAMGSGRGHS